jgi:hypothetical protein
MSRGIKRQILTRFVFTIIAQIVGKMKMAFHPWKMSIDGRLWAFYLHGLLSNFQTLERLLFFPTRTSSESAEQTRDAERSHEAGKLMDDVDSPGGREIS